MTILDHSDIPALAGEYVLGLLSDAESYEMEQQMQHNRSLRQAVGEWRVRFSDIDNTADSLPPSADLWQRIEQSISDRPATKPAKHMSFDGFKSWIRGAWSNLGLLRGFGLAGACAAILLAIVVSGVDPRLSDKPIAVAVLTDDANPGSPPGALVEAFADGSIRLVPLRDIPVPQGRTLQVWTLWDRAVGPVPLGILPRAENVRLTREGLPQPRADQIYEITLEPAGGSPTGRPTGPVLYKGLAALTL